MEGCDGAAQMAPGAPKLYLGWGWRVTGSWRSREEDAIHTEHSIYREPGAFCARRLNYIL